jgi:hypothetical protein
MRLAHVNAAPGAAAGRATTADKGVAAIEAIVGAGGIFGGYSLLSDAEGLGARQSWLAGSPFPDYTIPGLVLLVVIGGGMLAASAVTLLARRHASVAALCMAPTLILWGAVETLTIGWRGMAQLGLVAAFVAVPALALALYGARALRR